MENILDISFWANNLGHLPIHLKPQTPDEFIMLNGVKGNFCLDFSEKEKDKNVYFSNSWNSNTKNLISFEGDKLKLYNWNKKSSVEEIYIKTVEQNFERFYKYLISNSTPSSRDIVPSIIDIFKQFRSLTTEFRNPSQALNLLFILLASLEGDISNINREKWQISDIDIPRNFDYFIERFRQSTQGFKPDLSLILRHSSGPLFQEAQKEILFFGAQPDLFGTFYGENITPDLLYSSIHYTPTYLARSIVENSLNSLDLNGKKEIKVFDPACGSAEFIIEALKQLKNKGYNGKVIVKGYDSSETAIITSNFLLAYEKRKYWNNNLSYNIVHTEDSLTENWGETFDLLLMNPPFVSWELLKDKERKEAVRSVLGEHFSKRPNQASAFFFKAVEHLSIGGVIGCVIPSSLMVLDSYSKLRDEITHKIDFKIIGKLGNFVFEDALTDVSIFIGKKVKEENSLPTLVWTKNEKGVVYDALRSLRKLQYDEKTSIVEIDYSIYTPSYFPLIKNEWKAISYSEHDLIKDLKIYTATGKLATIGNLFNVSQGVRTGNQKAFKISEISYKALPEDEQKYFRPVIENESISNGIISTANFIWYPYDSNGILIKTEVELQEKLPEFYKVILPFKEQLANRARKDLSNWWFLSEHRAWHRKRGAHLISTEFGNSSSFAIDIKGSYIIERGNAWLPKKDMSDSSLYFYLALFTSSFFNKLLSIYSKQLAGGNWYDLGKKYTSSIPIPNAFKDEVKQLPAYSKLVELGRRLCEGDSYVISILDELVKIYYPNQRDF